MVLGSEYLRMPFLALLSTLSHAFCCWRPSPFSGLDGSHSDLVDLREPVCWSCAGADCLYCEQVVACAGGHVARLDRIWMVGPFAASVLHLGPVGLDRSSQGGEGWAGESHGGPLGERDCTEGVIEINGRGVPVQDGPLEAWATLGDGDGGDGGEECLTDAFAAEGGTDEEVLQVDARMAAPCGVVVEVESETDGLEGISCR